MGPCVGAEWMKIFEIEMNHCLAVAITSVPSVKQSSH